MALQISNSVREKWNISLGKMDAQDGSRSVSESESDFNYMQSNEVMEELRRQNGEMTDKAVASIVEVGYLRHFVPFMLQIIAAADEAMVGVQSAAVIALGKFMLCSRAVAMQHVDMIFQTLSQTERSAKVRHACLAVIADMIKFIPNQPCLSNDGLCSLILLLKDKILHPAVLHILLGHCSTSVINVDGHLGHVCACLVNIEDQPAVLSFLRTYFQSNSRQSTLARLLYKVYSEISLCQHLKTDLLQVMVVTLQAFGSPAIEQDLALALVKRLVERVDFVAVSLLPLMCSYRVFVHLARLIIHRKLAIMVADRDENFRGAARRLADMLSADISTKRRGVVHYFNAESILESERISLLTEAVELLRSGCKTAIGQHEQVEAGDEKLEQESLTRFQTGSMPGSGRLHPSPFGGADKLPTTCTSTRSTERGRPT
jgi:hypothetical protein